MNINDSKEEYLEELKQIRGLLQQNEEGGYVVWWTYIVWGIAFCACSLFHLYFQTTTNFSNQQVFLYIWLPGIIISGFVELVGWLLKMNQQKRPILNYSMLKFFFLLTSLMVFFLMVFPYVLKIPEAPISAFVFISISLTFIVFAKHTLDLFFPAGAGMFLIGLILYFTNSSNFYLTISSGLLSGGILMAGGFIARKLEKSNG